MPCIDRRMLASRRRVLLAGASGLLLAGCSSGRTSSVKLGTARPPDTAEYRAYQQRMARRMVEANGERAYLGPSPDPLLAIPVLEIELNRDGSVRRIDVLREPRQARDTMRLAIAAVERGAPYGDVGRLPRPWVFTETFLFDDDRRFKPRSLD